MEVPGDETKTKITSEEVERLSKLLSVAQAAELMTRRVGPDATDAELTADKKRCRRIAHVATKLLGSWGCKRPQKFDVAREAAIVDWPRWWQDHKIWLDNRRRYVATWSQKGGDERWAKSALVRLTNESSWIEYALRD